jgi:hypothetical protein
MAMIRHRNRLTEPQPPKVGWRVSEWTEGTGLSRAYAYLLINEGKLRSVKSGSARIILTSPSEYLESLAGKAA